MISRVIPGGKPTHSELLARLEACERQSKGLARTLGLSIFALGVVAAIGWPSRVVPASAAPGPAAHLRVSELVVVDAKGVERVRIGGQLPPALVDGKPGPGGGRAAGIVLLDEAGRAAYFVAGPDGESALRLSRGKDWVELRADEGGARASAVRSGELVSRQPVAAPSEVAASCVDLKIEAEKSPLSSAQLLDACRQRLGDADCRVCLGVN